MSNKRKEKNKKKEKNPPQMIDCASEDGKEDGKEDARSRCVIIEEMCCGYRKEGGREG